MKTRYFAFIPEEPLIRLPNFLGKFISISSDSKKDNIYISGVQSFIQTIWDEILVENKRTLHVRKLLPEKLGMHSASFYAYKNGKKALSLQKLYMLLLVWKEKCNKTKQELNDKWEELYNANFILSSSSRRRRTTIPKCLTPKLSYLMGWMCGDGHLKETNKHYVIKISEKSLKQIKEVLVPLFEKLFHLSPPVFRRYGKGYALQVGSKSVFKYFKDVLNLEVGQLPEIIEKMDQINKRFFLRGVFDSEGYVSKDRYRLTISQRSKSFLEEINRHCKAVGVHTSGFTIHKGVKGTWWTLRIDGKEKVMNFIKIIGSSHIDKMSRMERFIDLCKGQE